MSSVGPVGGEGGGVPPIFTGPVRDAFGTARVGGAVPPVDPAPPVAGGEAPAGAPARPTPVITLAGRLAAADMLPPPAALALALEEATRALQGGRAHDVLAALDATWSPRLAHDAPWYLRAAALELLARSDDAAQLLKEAIAQLPSSAALLYLLGVHALVEGDEVAARLATAHAAQLHDAEPIVLVLRAAVLARAGQPFEANDLLRRALAARPALPLREWFEVLVALARRPVRADAAAARPRLATPRAVAALPPEGGRAPAPTPARTSGAHAAVIPAGDSQDEGARRTTGAPDRDDAAHWAAPLVPPRDEPPVPPGLADAVRYGLALLDAPADAARAAVRDRGTRDDLATIAARAGLLAGRGDATPPTLLALVVVAGLAIAFVVPALRGLVLGAGGALLVAWLATRRRGDAHARGERPARPSVDRRVG